MVQTPVVALYPGSVLGILKSIVFVDPTAPLTCACSWVLSDETASVPFETSIASRSESVEAGAVPSAVVFTVMIERSWRSSSTSRHTLLRRRDFDARIDPLMAMISFGWKRVRLSGVLELTKD